MSASILVTSTFPDKEARVEIKEGSTWGDVQAAASKALGFDLAEYRWSLATFGEDVVTFKKTPEEKHGITAASVLIAIAPASLLPVKQKPDEENKEVVEQKYKGITNENIWKKLASGKNLKVPYEYFDEYSAVLLKHPTFLRLPPKMAAKLLSRDTLDIDSELDVFDTVVRYAEHSLKKDKLELKAENILKVAKDLIPQIRFLAMSSEDIAKKVVPSGLLTSEQVLDLFTYTAQRDMSIETKVPASLSDFTPKAREGTASNFWNPADCPDKRIELSNKNLTVSSPDNYLDANYGVRAKFGYSSGVHYWEIKVTLYNGGGNGYNTCGVCLKDAPLTAGHGYPLAAATGKAWVIGLIRLETITGSGHSALSYGSHPNIKTGDVVGLLLDCDAGTLRVYCNGTLVGTPFSSLKGVGKLYPCMGLGRLHRNIYDTNFKAKKPA